MILLNQFDNPEILTRYVFDQDNIRKDNSIHWRLFRPNEGCLSVFQINDLNEDEIWMLAKNCNQIKQLLGRADIDDIIIIKIGLIIDKDNNPIRHVNIKGWPEYKEEIRVKAMQLAAEAKLLKKIN